MSKSSHLRVRRHANPFTVPPLEGVIDWTARFGRSAPLEIEIGPAGGRFLLERARLAPEIDIIGFEIRTQMVERLAERIERAGLTNALVLHANASQALAAGVFPPGTLSKIYAFHPDPWVKKKHLKRRLLQPSFVEAAQRALAEGGEIIAQSDVRALAEEMLERLSAHPGLENLAGEGFAPTNPTQIPSETELYWLERGDPVYYLHFRKRPAGAGGAHEERG